MLSALVHAGACVRVCSATNYTHANACTHMLFFYCCLSHTRTHTHGTSNAKNDRENVREGGSDGEREGEGCEWTVVAIESCCCASVCVCVRVSVCECVFLCLCVSTSIQSLLRPISLQLKPETEFRFQTEWAKKVAAAAVDVGAGREGDPFVRYEVIIRPMARLVISSVKILMELANKDYNGNSSSNGNNSSNNFMSLNVSFISLSLMLVNPMINRIVWEKLILSGRT